MQDGVTAMKRLIFALVLAAAPPAFADEIKFVTEEYAPFNYSKDGEITGIAVEQVHRIAAAAGLDYTIDIMPWARAIALAESQPMHCVFTTGYNRDRAPRFLWITPLLKDQMVLVKRKDGKAAPATLVEAREMRVGSQRGDFAVEALEQIGFTNIDLAADVDLTVGKLLSGRIDLMPTSMKTYEKMLGDGLAVEKALTMAGQVYGIACHKDTPVAIIERLQSALDALILDGSQDRIFTDYGLPPNARTAHNGVAK